MNKEIWIANIILLMRKYQKENNIKRHCITNAQYLYDTIYLGCGYKNVRTKAVFVLSIIEETKTLYVNSGHLVLEVDGVIFDPSYEIFLLKNKKYYNNFKDFYNYYTILSEKHKKKCDLKEQIYNHTHFIKISEHINSGKCLISNKEYYNKQADYVEKFI